MNGIKILSINACDIYECNEVRNDGVINNLNYRYRSMLDDSLDLRRLLKMKDFNKFKDDGLLATNDVINVKFRKHYTVPLSTELSKTGYQLRQHLYKNGFNESTLTEIPNQRLFVTLHTLGSIGIIGFYIYGYFRPYNFAKHYNQTLKSALHLDGVTSFSMIPYIDPVESKYGLIAEIKF